MLVKTDSPYEAWTSVDWREFFEVFGSSESDPDETVADASVRAAVKLRSPTSTAIQLTVANGGVIMGPQDHQFTLHVEKGTLEPGTYDFEIVLDYPSGINDPLLRGVLLVFRGNVT